MAAKRAEWGLNDRGGDDKAQRIQVVLRGGKGVKKQRGLAFDGFQAKVMDIKAKLFVCKFGVGETSFYSVQMYGERIAAVLAYEWAARVEFFLDEYELSNERLDRAQLIRTGELRYKELDTFVELAEFAKDPSEKTLRSGIKRVRSVFGATEGASASSTG